MVERLDAVVESALKSMVRDLHTSVWCRREREIVNLFVLGHLIALCGANGVLHDPMQIGIEAAVPQLPGRGGHRKKPDVCKDIVIWPAPYMTCRGRDGTGRVYPLSVLEWKSLNVQDRSSSLSRKRREHQGRPPG